MDIKQHFTVMEWSMDTKNRCDDFEVYTGCAFVIVSTIGRDHAKMVSNLMSKHNITKQSTNRIDPGICVFRKTLQCDCHFC